MDQGVGIAAYGRGEVRVVLEHQAVVANVVDAVTRLHHGTQGHHLHYILLLFPLHVGKEPVQALADFLFRPVGTHLVAEAGDEGTEFLHLLRVGHIVDTVGKDLRFAAFGHFGHHLRHAAIGQEHELLHQFVGILGHLDIGGHGVSLLVHFKPYLGTVETDGAVLEPLFAELFGQAVERDEFGGIFPLRGSTFGQRFGVFARQCQVLGRSLTVALQRLLHLFVGEAAVGADDGVCQVPVEHFALRVHREDGGIGEFLLVGAERADEVAESLGQHGDGAIHEVDAGGPFLRFAVDDVALFHIVAHVGNVNAHFPQPLAEGADGERVVEVLGVVRVDGEGGHGAEVLPPGYIFGTDVGLQRLCCFLHLLRVDVGQAVLRQDGVHLGVVLPLAAQDVDDLSDGALGVGGPLHNFHHGLVAVLAALEFVLGDEDVRGQRAAFGDEEAVASLYLQLSDERVVGALQDVGDLGLTGMARTTCQHGHAHPVAVEGMERVTFAHEDALSAVVGQEGVVAVALAHKGTLHHGGAHGVAVVPPSVGGDIVVEHQFRQGVEHHHLGGMVRCSQFGKELLHVKIFLGLTVEQVNEHLQNGLLLQPAA